MNDPDPEEAVEPASLRFLRRMVTALTGVMIVGVLVVIGLLVTRLTANPVPLPEEITLPDGAKPLALTQGPDWYAVVTQDNRILIFDRLTGALTQEIEVQR